MLSVREVKSIICDPLFMNLLEYHLQSLSALASLPTEDPARRARAEQMLQRGLYKSRQIHRIREQLLRNRECDGRRKHRTRDFR